MASTLPFSTPSEARLHRRSARQGRRVTTPEQMLMWLVALASTIGGAAAHAHPTASPAADVVLSGLFAGVVALTGAYARRWSWLVAGGVAVVASNGGVAATCAVASVVIGFVAVALNVRSRAMGATVLALAAQALLRLPDFFVQGAPSIVAVAALVPLAISGYRYAPRQARRWIRRLRRYAIGFAIVIVGIALFTAIQARSSIDDGIKHAQAGFDAIGNGDRDLAVSELQAAASSFRSASSLAGGWWTAPVRVTPIAGQQLDAVEAMAGQGSDLSSAGARAAGAIDYEQLRVKGGAIDLGLLASATPAVEDTANALAAAARRLDQVSVDWLLPPIRDKYDVLGHEVRRALPAANVARDVVKVAPEVLGATTPQHYLVLFGSPSETRELGGFVGNYAEVTANHGKLTLTRSGRSLELSDPSGNHAYALRDGDYTQPFAPYRVNQFFGNVSASPNFADVADVAMQLYPQATGQQIDGVFYMDPYALAALLELTGPITLKNGGVKLTAKNAAKELLVDQYTQLEEKKERVDFLDEATRVTFEQLTTGDLPKPARVAQALNPMVDQGRMFGFSSHPEVNALFHELALDGDVPPANGGDLLWVTQSNENPSKIDAYLQREMTYHADVRPDTGQVDANLTITLKNSASADGLPVDVIGNRHDQPPGTNHMFLTVYSALHATGASLDDKAVGLAAAPRFGLTAYTVIVDVAAGQTVTLKLSLSGVVARGDDYRLTIVRQPTVNPDKIDVSVAGRSGWKVAGSGGKATIGDDRVTEMTSRFDGP